MIAFFSEKVKMRAAGGGIRILKSNHSLRYLGEPTVHFLSGEL